MSRWGRELNEGRKKRPLTRPSLMFFGGNVYLIHKQQPTAGMGSGLPIRTGGNRLR